MEAELARSYQPVEGRHDLAVDGAGRTRPGWERILDELDRLGPAELQRRQRAADRMVQAEGAGVLLHDTTDDAVRPWRLDLVPVVIPAETWSGLESALVERAELLQAVLTDLHGPRRLLHEGVIPVEAVATHATALRTSWSPDAPPRLIAVGADVVVDGEGRFGVLRDVTDVASGDGHALLARSITTRLAPARRAPSGLVGHGAYARALRTTLAAAAPPGRSSPRTVVLTGTPDDPGFVEHAYLATQLGYNVAEAADVIVRRGRVWLRSLEGLEPIDVLLRRIPEIALDPVEDDRVTGAGVAGLVEAVRAGGAFVANPCGVAIAEHLALQPFLDAASRFLLGRSLALAGLPTLWCGDHDQRATVLDALDRYVLHDTDPVDPELSVFGSALDDEQVARWTHRIQARPERYVAQPKVELGTAPRLAEGQLVPGAVALRTQVLLGPERPLALPGGHGRVLDPTVPVVRQRSGVGKDVWVLDPSRRDRVRVAPPAIPQVDLRRSVPTRAAEAMYWVGRNAERAEMGARTVFVWLTRVGPGQPDPLELAALVRGLHAVSGGLAAAAPGGEHVPDLDAEIRGALAGRPGTVVDALVHLVASARGARQFLSARTWRLLAMIDAEAANLVPLADKPAIATFDATEALDRVLVPLAALSGLTNESVVRGPAWRFLDVGRRLERALLVLGVAEAVLDHAPDAQRSTLALEAALAACESLVAYRRRYRSDVTPDAVADLLLGDPDNPRSVRFQLDQLVADLHDLPDRPVRRTQLAALRDAARELEGHLPLVGVPSDDGSGAVAQLVLAVRAHVLAVGDTMGAGWFTERPRRVR